MSKSRIGAAVLPHLPIGRRTFDTLRYEWRALRARSVNAINPAYYFQVKRLRRQNNLSVNIGSGGKGLAGWLNVELIRMRDTTLCLDVRRRLPLADSTVGRLFAEHVVEHMDFKSDIPRVLEDWHRVMQPGARLRIVVPDARRFAQAYCSGRNDLWRELGWDLEKLPSDIYTPMHVMNHIFHQGGEHLFAYDFETLAWILRRAGFHTIEQMSYRTSRDPKLAIDQPNHELYSLYVEAVK